MSDEARVWTGDARALERALRARISGEVRFDDGSRALYATDASNYRQVPIGVVIPKTADDVVAAFEVARGFAAPILARGGGTSLAGQCCNVAIVLDFSKYLNRVIEINPGEKWARVEPGIVLDDLRAAALKHGLTYGPDPATHAQNTLGGMIGNNSCGMHAQMAGKVEDNVYELDILTYDGLRLTVGKTPPTSSSASVGAVTAPAKSIAVYASCAIAMHPTSASDFRIFRAASRDIRSTNSSPKTNSTSRARWWEPNVPAPSSFRPRSS
ncbi:MAG TPA: FAD-dependent oxidoreductase [Candidatus Cybelea sp.]